MTNIEMIKNSQEISGILKTLLTYLDKYLDRKMETPMN